MSDHYDRYNGMDKHGTNLAEDGTDLISRDAVKELLNNNGLPYHINPVLWKELTDLPSAQPTFDARDTQYNLPIGTDCISRQAAIDALGEEPPVWYDGEDEIAERNQWKRDIEAIEQLPPIQPEIIRCKDCKHWDGVDTCDVIDAPVWDNDFCSFAERRTDE